MMCKELRKKKEDVDCLQKVRWKCIYHNLVMSGAADKNCGDLRIMVK